MKVAIFSGREHHMLKLLPIYAAFPDSFFFVANNAINIDPAIEPVQGLRHVHIYDYIGEDIPDTQAVMFDYEVFTHIPPFWAFFSDLELYEVIAAFTNFLEAEQPDVVLGLHENNFWFKVMSFICAQKGVPVAVFQEGLLRHSDQDSLNKQATAAEYAGTLFVWGRDTKKHYTKAGIDAKKIKVTGPPHLDEWHTLIHSEEFEEWKFNILEGKRAFVFAPSTLNYYNGDIQQDIMLLAQWAFNKGYLMFLKFHPFEKHLGAQFADIPSVRVWEETSIEPLLAFSEAMVCQHSTVGLEALGLGLPLVEFNLTAEPVIQSWHDIGVATQVSNIDELDRIEEAMNTGDRGRTSWIKNNILVDGDATKRIVKHLVGLVQND